MTYTRLSDVHPELFHYTSNEGLFSILKTQYLIATDWRHLNDISELMHFSELLPRLFRPELVRRATEIASENSEAQQFITLQGGVDTYCAEQAKYIAEKMYNSLGLNDENERLLEFYITSFCTPEGAFAEVRNHGLLSQWRYYGQQGGYALVFDTAELEHLMKLEHSHWDCRISFGEVGYSSDSPDVLEKRIESLSVLREVLRKCQFDSSEAFIPLLQPFLDCCIHYKHWAFAEENEVRLVAVLNGPRMLREDEERRERKRDCFTNRENREVPCLNLFEGLEINRACRLPIRKIIVGPGPNQKQNETKLRNFLQDAGYNIEVTCSHIPIRF
ncbi:MAG: DUF2971 domain-containing protein [Methylomicrobium sp.]